jgi:hypothetical protein
MTNMHVEGGRKIALVAKALRHLGTDRTIVNEMTKRIRKTTPVIRDAVRKNALATLPKAGGLGAWVARASMRVAVSRTDRKAGVYLVVGRDSVHGRTDIVGLDAGKTRAPLWGNRKHWYPHIVKPGFATSVMAGPGLDMVRDEISAAIDDAVAQVLDGIR